MRAENINKIADKRVLNFASMLKSKSLYYVSFEAKGDSMDDGTRRSIQKGDFLKCREIKSWEKIADLKNLNYPVVVVCDDEIINGRITHQEPGKIILSKYNPLFEAITIHTNTVKTLYLVENIIRPSSPASRQK